MNRNSLAAGISVLVLATAAVVTMKASADTPKPQPGEVAVTLTGGHDTDKRDGGRPVALIAAALGVPDEIFRDAFSHVHPAQNGGPTGDEARKNKHELLSRLEKHGVTNDRLDEVSNFYRYRPQNGELWKHKDAVVFATVKDGKVTGFRIAEPGYGYSSPPTLGIEGTPKPAFSGVPKIALLFDKELEKNGSIKSVTQIPPMDER